MVTAQTSNASTRADLRAAIVLVIIAIPLCLGIALASGAPLSAGLLSGIIGGVVVGGFGSSKLMVSGPAAGLSAIVIAGLATLGSFNAFLAAVVIAGLLQLGMSALRVGVVGYYFPSSVVRGMIAGIGAILILKQLPHLVGYDVDYLGDVAFQQWNNATTFTAIRDMFSNIQPGAVIISLSALVMLLAWDFNAKRGMKLFPAPLLAVLAGVGINWAFTQFAPSLALSGSHLVQLPIAPPGEWGAFLAFPDVRAFSSLDTWRIGLTIAVVASLETLLSLEATDKLDTHKRESDANRELMAQGIGNSIAGLVGGLPIAGVIVRSAANINAGAQSRLSTVVHGGLLLLVVLAIPMVLNLVPIAALAAVLLYIGVKLASPALFRSSYRMGGTQFTPFLVTMVAIVLTDLLVGILVGLAVGLVFILRDYLRQPALRIVSPPGAVLTRYRLPDQATFLSKANIERTLEALPPGSRVEIDARYTTRVDIDVLEQLHEFAATARLRDIDYRLVGVPDVPTTPPLE